MMSASQEIGMILGIDAEARRLERERVLSMFAALADQMDAKALETDLVNNDDFTRGLVWAAAAFRIRQVCDEASRPCQDRY